MIALRYMEVKPGIVVTRAFDVDRKYDKHGLGVVICEEAEQHIDYEHAIKFRLIVDLKTGYVLAKVSAKDVPSTVKHIVAMEWCYNGTRKITVETYPNRYKKVTKEVTAAYYTSPHMKAELNSYMQFQFSGIDQQDFYTGVRAYGEEFIEKIKAGIVPKVFVENK